MIKKALFTLLCLLFFTTSVFASYPLGTSWNANDVEDNVIGYRVYASRESQEYTIDSRVANITEGEAVEIQLEQGKWYLVLTAYNADGESGWSNEIVRKVGVPDAPVGFRIKVTVTVEVN